MKPASNYPSIQKLLTDLNGSPPSYAQLLSTYDWRRVRDLIIKRDKHCCTHCGTTATEYVMGRHLRLYSDIEVSHLINSGFRIYTADDMLDLETGYAVSTWCQKPIYLHVHHHYYILGKYPWQYNEQALVTLCNSCHTELHENIRIPYFQDESRQIELSLEPCHRCHGAGHFEEYAHIQNGICFLCRGAKYMELIGMYPE